MAEICFITCNSIGLYFLNVKLTQGHTIWEILQTACGVESVEWESESESGLFRAAGAGVVEFGSDVRGEFALFESFVEISCHKVKKKQVASHTDFDLLIYHLILWSTIWLHINELFHLLQAPSSQHPLLFLRHNHPPFLLKISSLLTEIVTGQSVSESNDEELEGNCLYEIGGCVVEICLKISDLGANSGLTNRKENQKLWYNIISMHIISPPVSLNCLVSK